MERQQPILSERSEFIGCSEMSLKLQKQHVSPNAGSLQLLNPDLGSGLRKRPYKKVPLISEQEIIQHGISGTT